MTFELLVFWLFAAIVAFSAFRVITVNNPVFAAMFLVLTFFTSAGIWLLLEAEFLAITLVLVYVGAVMVLFLFVVMMLDVNVVVEREGFVSYRWAAVAVGAVMLVEMVFLIATRYFRADRFPAPERAAAEGYSNTEYLGRILYSEYLFQFEIAAIILLVAIVAAIALTMRRRPETKYQTPGRQVQVRKADRLRVVSMAPGGAGAGLAEAARAVHETAGRTAPDRKIGPL